MKDFAEQVATQFLQKLEPDLHRAMVERIIEIAAEKWRYQFCGDSKITALIDDGVEKALAEKYAPVIAYLADRKARAKVLRRAEQNSVGRQELAALMPDLFAVEAEGVK